MNYKTKKNLITFLFLIISMLTIYNIIFRKTITLAPMVDEKGKVQLAYLDAIDTIMYGLFGECWADSILLEGIAMFILCTPILGIIASIFGKRHLQLSFAVLLIIYHAVAVLEIPYRIGLRYYELGGAVAYAVFNLNYFITLGCSLLICFLCIHMESKKNT